MIKSIINWFIYSSANPNTIALTIKGLVPLLVLIGIDEATSTQLVGQIGESILILGQFFTAILTIYGLIRKIFLTIKSKI